MSHPELTELLHETASDIDRHDHGLTLDTADEGIDDHLTHRLTASRAKHLALSLDQHLDTIDHLAATTALPELRRQLTAARTAERITNDTHGHTPDELPARRNRLTDIAEGLAIGVRVSPADRNNVGTITAIDEHAGAVTVDFVSVTGAHTSRNFDWDDLRLIDPTHTMVANSPDRQHTLGARLDEIDRALESWTDTFTQLGGTPGRAHTLTAAIDTQIDRAAHDLRALDE